jgi:hypothetical protein
MVFAHPPTPTRADALDWLAVWSFSLAFLSRPAIVRRRMTPTWAAVRAVVVARPWPDRQR